MAPIRFFNFDFTPLNFSASFLSTVEKLKKCAAMSFLMLSSCMPASFSSSVSVEYFLCGSTCFNAFQSLVDCFTFSLIKFLQGQVYMSVSFFCFNKRKTSFPKKIKVDRPICFTKTKYI